MITDKPTPDDIITSPSVDFEVLDPEPWIRCKLKDGTVIKVRSIVTNIKQLQKKLPDGSNNYVVQINTNLRVAENILKRMK